MIYFYARLSLVVLRCSLFNFICHVICRIELVKLSNRVKLPNRVKLATSSHERANKTQQIKFKLGIDFSMIFNFIVEATERPEIKAFWK